MAFGRSRTSIEFPNIGVDGENGIRQLVTHLISKGNRRIAFISAPEMLTLQVDRFAGFRKGLHENGIDLDYALVFRVLAHGGFISYRNMPDDSQVPYELNINYFDALSDPKSGESLDIQVDRFVTAHAIMMALVGVPGIYFHSLVGSRGWVEGVKMTGMKRAVNRQKLNRQNLENEISDLHFPRAQVMMRLKLMLMARAAHQVFDPYAPQKILALNPAVFAVLRGETGKDQAICLHNVSDTAQTIHLDLNRLGKGSAADMLSGKIYRGNTISMQLEAYQTVWLDLSES